MQPGLLSAGITTLSKTDGHLHVYKVMFTGITDDFFETGVIPSFLLALGQNVV